MSMNAWFDGKCVYTIGGEEPPDDGLDWEPVDMSDAPRGYAYGPMWQRPLTEEELAGLRSAGVLRRGNES